MTRPLHYLTAAVLALAVVGCSGCDDTGDADSTGQRSAAPTARPTEAVDDNAACSLFFETSQRAKSIIEEVQSSGGTPATDQTVRAYPIFYDFERAARKASDDLAAAMKSTAEAFEPLAVGEKFVPATYEAAVGPALKLCAPLLDE